MRKLFLVCTVLLSMNSYAQSFVVENIPQARGEYYRSNLPYSDFMYKSEIVLNAIHELDKECKENHDLALKKIREVYQGTVISDSVLNCDAMMWKRDLKNNTVTFKSSFVIEFKL